MKRAIVFLAAGGILTTLTLCLAATSPSPSDESSEIEQLRKEVASLRERVESLEKRLKERTLQIPRGRAIPPMTIDPNILLRPRTTPKDWREFEFNGMPYYVVPIDARSAPGSGK